MRRSRFTESQIVAILAEGDVGAPVAAICRKHGISSEHYCHWKLKYSRISVNKLKRIKARHEAENAKLKRMYTDLVLVNTAMKDVISRKL